MASPFTELERSLFGWGGLGRRMAQMFEDVEPTAAYTPTTFASWMRLDVWDTGPSFVVWAEVPGLSEKDIQIVLKQDVLTITGERKPEVADGYQAHRRERATVRYSRAIRLGVKVDGDKVSATVKNGVLTVTLPKAPEMAPRTIAVRAS